MASPRSRPPASPQPSLDFRSTDTMPRGDVCPCLPEVSCVGRRTRLGFSPLPLHRPDPANQSSDVSRHPPFASSGTFPGLTDGFSTPTTSTWTSAAPAAPAALLHTSSLLQIFSPTPVFHPNSCFSPHLVLNRPLLRSLPLNERPHPPPPSCRDKNSGVVLDALSLPVSNPLANSIRWT